MKKNVLLLFATTMLMCISCNDQKPSQRENAWDEEKAVKNVTLSGEKVYVPFKRTDSGLAEVQVSLNGSPFNMWWDTGASITSISSLEFIKLMKENKVSAEDKIRSIQVAFADGSSGVEDVYLIHEIFIQGKNNDYLKLEDVAVTVSESLGAPLLVGQNVISQLPKHKFNDETEEIEFDK